MQQDLFDKSNKREWPLGEQCRLILYYDLFEESQAKRYFATLRQEIDWQQSKIRIAGRMIKIPRLNAWYGDKQAHYRYSGTSFKPLDWLPELLQIKKKIEYLSGDAYNSVLANLYRNGQDSVAWHADNEPHLGQNPSIASVSLGETRVFQLKHRLKKSLPRIDIELPGNSLLMMAGRIQHHWQHQVPKTRMTVDERISLTYRRVLSHT